MSINPNHITGSESTDMSTADKVDWKLNKGKLQLMSGDKVITQISVKEHQTGGIFNIFRTVLNMFRKVEVKAGNLRQVELSLSDGKHTIYLSGRGLNSLMAEMKMKQLAAEKIKITRENLPQIQKIFSNKVSVSGSKVTFDLGEKALKEFHNLPSAGEGKQSEENLSEEGGKITADWEKLDIKTGSYLAQPKTAVQPKVTASAKERTGLHGGVVEYAPSELKSLKEKAQTLAAGEACLYETKIKGEDYKYLICSPLNEKTVYKRIPVDEYEGISKLITNKADLSYPLEIYNKEQITETGFQLRATDGKLYVEEKSPLSSLGDSGINDNEIALPTKDNIKKDMADFAVLNSDPINFVATTPEELQAEKEFDSLCQKIDDHRAKQASLTEESKSMIDKLEKSAQITLAFDMKIYNEIEANAKLDTSPSNKDDETRKEDKTRFINQLLKKIPHILETTLQDPEFKKSFEEIILKYQEAYMENLKVNSLKMEGKENAYFKNLSNSARYYFEHVED